MIALIFSCLTIILAPLYIIRSNFLLPLGNFPIIPTTLLEIMIIITFFATIFDFFQNRENIKIFRTKLDPLILLFLISAIIAALTSYNFYGGLGILRAYFLEPIIFYYTLIYHLRKYGIKIYINSLIISGLWLALLGILQKFTGQFSLAPNEIKQGRVSGVYNSANALALYLGPIILLNFVQILKNKSIKRIGYILSFLILAVALVFTRSRGGQVGLTFGFLTFGYLLLINRSKQLKRFWYLLPTILVLISIVVVGIYYNNHQFLPPNYGNSYSGGDTLQIRYYIWSSTIQMLKDHPIFGVGLDGFKTVYTNQYRVPEFQEEFQYPHNIFLNFWSETGLFGLFSFLLLLFSAAGLVLRKLKNNKNKYLGFGLVAVIVYWLVHGLVDVPYFKNDLSLEFWIVIAFIQFWTDQKA